MGIETTPTQSFNQNPNLDSTTYIYQSADLPVPFADYFLSIEYLTSQKEFGLSDTLIANTKISPRTTTYGNHKFAIQYSDFVFIILVLLFSMLAYIRFYSKNYLSRVVTSLFNYSYSTSFFKEKNLAFVLNGNLMLTIFFISTALCVGVITDYFDFTNQLENKWLQLIVNLIIVLFIIVFYKLAYRLCGILFDQYRIVSEYLFYFSNLLKILGIFYLIMYLCAFFSHDSWKVIFIYTIILVTVLVYLIKISRILLIMFKNRFSLYYLILYFCALEIVPVLLLFKIFTLIVINNSSFLAVLV